MTKLIRLSALVIGLSLVASIASAAGVNLAWTDCGSFGAQNKTFACNVNTGSDVLYGSFVPPAGVTKLTGNEMVLDLLTENPAFTQWWQFKNVGSCRQTSLAASFAANASGNCGDYWSGQASGGLASYVVGQSGMTNRARVLLVCAVDQNLAGPVDNTTEYYSFALTMNHAKTVGTGACTGCTDKVCIVLNSIKLTQPVGVGDFTVSDPVTSQIATWQGEATATCLPVPARNRTWGQVKSLYR